MSNKSINKKGKEEKEKEATTAKQLLKTQLFITAYSDQLDASLELA